VGRDRDFTLDEGAVVENLDNDLDGVTGHDGVHRVLDVVIVAGDTVRMHGDVGGRKNGVAVHAKNAGAGVGNRTRPVEARIAKGGGHKLRIGVEVVDAGHVGGI